MDSLAFDAQSVILTPMKETNLFLAETKGGKYALRAYRNPNLGGNSLNEGIMIESLTNGIIQGCMGPVSREQAAKWAAGRMAESREIDGINYIVKLDTLNR